MCTGKTNNGNASSAQNKEKIICWSLLDTSRGLCAGGGGEDVHHRRAGDRLRTLRQRAVRGGLLALPAAEITRKGAWEARRS